MFAVAVLIEGPRIGWASPAAVAGYAALAAAAVGFGWAESRSREPLIDLGLFRDARFTGAVVSAVAVFVAFSTTLVMTTFLTSPAWSCSGQFKAWVAKSASCSTSQGTLTALWTFRPQAK